MFHNTYDSPTANSLVVGDCVYNLKEKERKIGRSLKKKLSKTHRQVIHKGRTALGFWSHVKSCPISIRKQMQIQLTMALTFIY